MIKRSFLLFFFFIALYSGSYAQSVISGDDWQKIVNYLTSEDWENAHKLSVAYLKKIPADQNNNDEAAILRYMFILSESGLMNINKSTKEQAYESVKNFQGLTIILPGHPIAVKQGFNSINLANDKADTLMITASNKTATDIFSFEYIIAVKPFSLDEFKQNEGKVYRIGGRLKSIKAEGNFLPRFNMVIDNAILEPQ